MQLYSKFYKETGIRVVAHLSKPKVTLINELELPKESVLHHIPLDDLDMGPTPSDTELAKYPGRLMVNHHYDLINPSPIPRPNTEMSSSKYLTEFKRKYGKIRTTLDANKSMRDDRTLVIHNYAPLSLSYIYPPNVFSNFYKWNNVLNSSFKYINESMVGNDRQHFIVLPLPEHIPSLKMIRKAKGEPKDMLRKIMLIFSEPTNLFLAKFVEWLGDGRVNSDFNVISDKHLDRLNIIFTDGGYFTTINLDKLLDVLLVKDGKTGAYGTLNKMGLVKTFNILKSLRMISGGDQSEVDDADVKDDDEPTPAKIETPKTTTPVEPTKVEPPKKKQDDVVKNILNDLEFPDEPDYKEVDTLTEPDYIEEETTEVNRKAVTKELDEIFQDEADGLDDYDDLEAELDEWDIKQNEVSRRLDTLELSLKAKAPRSKLEEIIEAKAEKGNISAPEYKRLQRLLEASDKLPSPVEGVTLREFSVIKDEDLQITEEDRLLVKELATEHRGIVDKSHLKSVTQVMDKKYIKNVFKKDIVSNALSVENAGVVISKYENETVVDSVNDYTVTRMKLTPLDGGDTSTISFTVPNVDEDGIYTMNGKKYRMRKQRIDLPIRKVKPDTVSLTSAYGRLSVVRSSKVVVNFEGWLHKQIRIKAYDYEDTDITEVVYGNNFDNKLKLPRVYSMLSKEYSKVITPEMELYFNYKNRIDLVKGKDETLLKEIEMDDMVLVGKKGTSYLVMDNTDTIYAVKGKSIEPLGDIVELLNLPNHNIPTDIAEFNMFTKNVPVGMILGHRFGLSKLMSILKVTPRRVSVGSSVNMLPSEYGIRFKDETLIFSRTDKQAQLILAGLNRYHRDLRRYNVDDFDNPDYFSNVFEANGIRVGFMRELELVFDMFVDPITLGILQSRSEPETLDGLLLMACELLLTDHHKEETDMTEMRIRGYERMSSIVYNEVVRSVRRYRSRGVGGATKIEMNPEAVWQAINKDTSVSLVEELNPIENIRESELMTYMGTGGRSAQSMVKRTRQFTDGDVGVVSEGTIDSGMVGINAYLTPNATFNNMRGTAEFNPDGDVDNTALLSTVAMLSPALDHDD